MTSEQANQWSESVFMPLTPTRMASSIALSGDEPIRDLLHVEPETDHLRAAGR